MLKPLQDAYYGWKYFHLPQKRLHILAWYLQDQKKDAEARVPKIAENLNSLNNKRKVIQKEIGLISKNNYPCSECVGSCCLGAYNHFTAVDFIIRHYSSNPLKEYGLISRDSEFLNNFSSLKNHLKYFLANHQSAKNKGISKSSVCSYLTKTGCALPFGDRPIHCVIFACKLFRDSLELEQNKFKQLLYLLKEMELIEYAAFKLYKNDKLGFRVLLKYWTCI